MPRYPRRSLLSYLCSCILVALVAKKIVLPAFAGVHLRVDCATRQVTAGQSVRDGMSPSDTDSAGLDSGNDSESPLGRLMGRLLPEITLPNQDGMLVTLSSSRRDAVSFDAKHLVVYFFGGPLSPLCTREAQAFRDSHANFSELGAEVVGVSRETMDVLKSFKAKENLPFDLLFDEAGKVRDLLDIPRDLFFDGRQTYVISRDGVVRNVYNNQLEPEKHVDQALKTAAKLFAADKAAELAQAQALEQEAKRFAEDLAGSLDAAVQTVVNVAFGRVASVAKDTQELIEEVKEAPVKYGKIVQERAENAASASEQQLRETASASQRRLQEARYEMQDEIIQNSGIAFQKAAQDQIETAANQAKDGAVEARYNFQDWFTQNTGIALQKSAQEKMASARDEANAMTARARDYIQDGITQNTGIAFQRSARGNLATAGNEVKRMAAQARGDTQDWFTQNTGTALQRSGREIIFTATNSAKDKAVEARYEAQDWITQNSGIALQRAAQEKIAAANKEAQEKAQEFAQGIEQSFDRNIEEVTTQTQLHVDSVKRGIVDTLALPQDEGVETQNRAHLQAEATLEANQALMPESHMIQVAKNTSSHSADPVAEQAMLFKKEMQKASSKQDVSQI